MRALIIVVLVGAFCYWLIHAGLAPPQLVPSPLLEYMAEGEQRRINEIRSEMQMLQRELNSVRKDSAARRTMPEDLGDPKKDISLQDIIKPAEPDSRPSPEEKRLRERLQELSARLDEHRDRLIWCQRGLAH